MRQKHHFDLLLERVAATVRVVRRAVRQILRRQRPAVLWLAVTRLERVAQKVLRVLAERGYVHDFAVETGFAELLDYRGDAQGFGVLVEGLYVVHCREVGAQLLDVYLEKS